MTLRPAIIGLLVATLGCETVPDSGWWTYRRDAAHSHHSAGELTLPLGLQWQREFDSEDGFSWLGPPVFGPGRVYVGQTHLTDVLDERLLALRLTDGADEWSFSPAEAGIEKADMAGPPVLANGKIYTVFNVYPAAAANNSSTRVYALGPDGDVEWSQEIGAPPSSHALSPTTAAGGLLFLLVRRDLTYYLYALDQDTGDEAWRVVLDQVDQGLAQFPQFVVIGARIYVTTIGETIGDTRALDLDNEGAELWRFQYPHWGRTSSPVHLLTHHEAVYVAVVSPPTAAEPLEMARLYALDASDGDLLWQQQRPVETLDTQKSYLAIRSGRVVMMAGRSIEAFAALGSVPVWSREFPGERRIASSAPASIRVVPADPAQSTDVLFYTDGLGVFALRAWDGVPVWEDDNVGPGIRLYGNLVGGVAVDQGMVAVALERRLRVYGTEQ